MNFLELCVRTRELAGIAGSGPSTTVAQTGELLRVVHWVQSSWIDIQNLHRNWNFLYKDFSFSTVQGQGEYAPTQIGASDLKVYDMTTLRCQETAKGYVDRQFMDEWDFFDFRDTYRYTTLNPGRPIRFAVDPKDKSLWMDGIPDSVGYTITGRYWSKPVPLVADTDIPAMPEDFHMLIPYWALSMYAGYEAASEAKQEANERKPPLLSALRNDQLPDLLVGGPM